MYNLTIDVILILFEKSLQTPNWKSIFFIFNEKISFNTENGNICSFQKFTLIKNLMEYVVDSTQVNEFGKIDM